MNLMLMTQYQHRLALHHWYLPLHNLFQVLLNAHREFVIHWKDILQANEGGDVVTDFNWLQLNNHSCIILSHVIVLFCISHSPCQSHVSSVVWAVLIIAIIIEVDSLNWYGRDTTASLFSSTEPWPGMGVVIDMQA